MKFQPIKKYILTVLISCFISALLACSFKPVVELQEPVQQPISNLETTIKGIAFHDYNGNGTKEYDEPILPGTYFELHGTETGKIFENVASCYSV